MRSTQARPAIAPTGTLEAVRALLRISGARAGSACGAPRRGRRHRSHRGCSSTKRWSPRNRPTRSAAASTPRISTDSPQGDLVYARHILFAVTPGAPLQAIRAKAEETLLTPEREPERFEALARECSNCSSGASGGNLGQLTRDEIVPEFAAAVFDSRRTGLLSSLVRTRYGFHIVVVDQRVAGQTVPFEAVRERIAAELRELVQERALRQYVQVLAGRAGVDIPGSIPHARHSCSNLGVSATAETVHSQARPRPRSGDAKALRGCVLRGDRP